MRVPWPLTSLDPHRIDDGAAAIFAGALFDTLYAKDDSGAVVPSLAESEPEASGHSLRVVLRTGLKTARGHALDARDAAFSLGRARNLGARGWLADLAPPSVERDGALLFAMKDAAKLTALLSSPMCAIVPAGFLPSAPDGTGAFRADKAGDGLVLRRNVLAANGPSLLDEIAVHPAADLAESLRAFEGGEDDLGWLGSGLHEPRPGSRPFDAGMVGWAVLSTGREALAWDAPGVAQRLVDGISPSRLAYLGLGAPWVQDAGDGWGGPAGDLMVPAECPWLMELGRAVSASLTRPGHEVVPRAANRDDYARRRASRAFSLCLEIVRPLAPGPLAALTSLATLDNPSSAVDLVKHPPRVSDVAIRTLTRTMRLGIVGEVRVQGGRAPDVLLVTAPGGGLDFGSSSRTGQSA